MTPEQLKDRGAAAQSAWEEFLKPAVEAARAKYLAALSKHAHQLYGDGETKKIAALSAALNITDIVEADIIAIINHGEVAARDQARIRQIESLPDRKKRWL